MERLEQLDAVAVPLAWANCDTDQIIPASFLQKPRSDDFGRYLFSALRFNDDGSEKPDFVLNQQAYRSARIMVAGQNFGCGSSREHAVWALYDYGIRAVIAASFGDIFFFNSLKNGLLPIVLADDVVAGLLHDLKAQPGRHIAIDLPAQRVTLPDGRSLGFEINSFAKDCLIHGMDELDFTLSQADRIAAFEQQYDRT
jgi:3-isopropylmalate/(R)-2-methylmalate dehydratase small subunit